MLLAKKWRSLNFTFLKNSLFSSSHETYHWTNRQNGPNNRETYSQQAQLYHLFLFETFTIKEEMFSIIKFIRGQLYNSESLTEEKEKAALWCLLLWLCCSESLRIGTTVRHYSEDIQQNYEINFELNFIDEIRLRRRFTKNSAKLHVRQIV